MQFIQVTRPGQTGQTDPNILECGGIRFTPEGVGVIESGRVVLTVYKNDIHRIILRRGWQAQHPIIQIVVGGLLLAPGLILLLVAFSADGAMVLRTLGGGVFLVILGGWLLFEGLRRGQFLHVETTIGWKKLSISKSPEAGELNVFLRSAKDNLGYPVEADAVDSLITGS